MSAFPDIGTVEVIIHPEAGAPGKVTVRSTRRLPVANLFVGRPADASIPKLISMLFALCPAAQSCAWEAAASLAETGRLPEQKLAQWGAVVQLEAMSEHLRCLLVELPRALGIDEQLDLRPLGFLRMKITGVRGVDAAGRENLLRVIRGVAASLLFGSEELIPKLSEWRSQHEIEDWITRLPATLRSGLTYLSTLPRTLGATGVRDLDPESPTVRKELASGLRESAFCFEPRLFSGPAQTSALTRRATCPALMPGLLRRSPGCFDYYYARVLELGSWCGGFEPPEKLVSGFSPEPGVGISFVQTARGTLTHRVRITEGVVREASIVAPTEWNFVPGGAAEQALNALSVSDWKSWQTRAEIVLRQFDACIPYKIVTESGHA